MESVKRYDCTNGKARHCYGCYRMTESAQGDYVSWADFDRVSAENLALQQRLTVQDQRVDELVELLTAAQNAMPWVSNSELWERIYTALKPTAEAEPQCLLCLDKKTVPGNIPGGFVKDCCGEEG